MVTFEKLRMGCSTAQAITNIEDMLQTTFELSRLRRQVSLAGSRAFRVMRR
jgi:hypothetical protein